VLLQESKGIWDDGGWSALKEMSVKIRQMYCNKGIFHIDFSEVYFELLIALCCVLVCKLSG